MYVIWFSFIKIMLHFMMINNYKEEPIYFTPKMFDNREVHVPFWLNMC